jgi:UDP-N-acetylmuramate dehydrogenase
MIYYQNMKMLENEDLRSHTTFRLGPIVRYLTEVREVEELNTAYAFAREKNLPVHVLGSGSNVILAAESVWPAMVLKICLPGFDVIREDDSKVVLKIGAGENWDQAVERAVRNHWWGLEAMSAIPGTAGATPIQNVGAYGSEIADVLIELETYQVETGDRCIFTKEQCRFDYRDSIFKHEQKDRHIITSITIELSKLPREAPNYPGVVQYFTDRSITSPTLAQIREAIIDIRSIKLPDPQRIASVGSFFKNPIVDAGVYEQLNQTFPQIIAFPFQGKYKIGAGWLLENLGYKGKNFGPLSFYKNNALVLINHDADYAELVRIVEEVKSTVREKFGINLEQEPMTMG